MKYFKNTELANIYNVSEKSVRNWIDSAEEGRLELQLHTENGKQYVANTSKNTALIKELAKKGKKYTNSRGYRVVTPSDEFYKIYDDKQVFDIMSNIDIHREIPRQYGYFGPGALHWDEYAQKKIEHGEPSSLLTNTIDLLRASQQQLDNLMAGHQAVNVIDIGVGNALPVRGLLEHLEQTGRLNRYIGLDISQDMLDIAEKKITAWFSGKVHFEGYVRDINYERFEDLLIDDAFGTDGETIMNLVLFLGGTLSNFRDPSHLLRTIHDSIGKEDILISSLQLDTEQARRYFDFTADGGASTKVPLMTRVVLDLLNIDESLYDVEQYFDSEHMARQRQLKLKMALSIEFRLNEHPKVINLNKGDKILLWRHQHRSIMEILRLFDANNFDLLQATRSKDGECLQVISQLKTGE